MIQVVDASVVVAALVDDSPVGRWCEEALQATELAAPHLMPFEVANILRRLAVRDEIDASAGAVAVDDLGRLAVDLAPFARLVTLDERLARSAGATCQIVTPPEQ